MSRLVVILALWLAMPLEPALSFVNGEALRILPAARPNPYNLGNCFQYKDCLGESIGNMPVENPEYCKPIGGKSWKNARGKCFNFPDGPQPLSPDDFKDKAQAFR